MGENTAGSNNNNTGYDKKTGGSSAEKVFVSWSGGKDAYLSLLLALEQGLEVNCLLNFIGHDGYSRSHGIPGELLQRQAEVLGYPLEKKKVTWETYEPGFEEAVSRLREREKVAGGVFGDINLEEHRQWLEKMGRRCGINCHLPLWGMGERQVTRELLRRAGKAVIVSLRNDLLEEKWLGQELNLEFMEHCENKGLSPCGERGEFHTLVVGGPCFLESLQYCVTGKERKDNRTHLRLTSSPGR